MFLQSQDSGENNLYFTTQSQSNVEVIASAPLFSSQEERAYVRAGSVSRITLPRDLRASGTGLESKGVRITATDEVAMYGLNYGSDRCGGFVAFPVETLGTQYYVMTTQPSNGYEQYAQFGVVAIEDFTYVTITFPSTSNIRVNFQGQEYGPNKQIEVYLNRYQSIQIQDTNYNDLTGTMVQATQRVAVFSGALHTNVGTGTNVDALVEQMPPVQAMGKTFVVVPTPYRTVGDQLKIISTEDNNVVTISGQDLRLDFYYRSQAHDVVLNPYQYAWIEAEKPVIVVQLVSGTQGNDVGQPSMIIVPPVEQYMNDYTFIVPDEAFTSVYLMISAKRSDSSGIVMDGRVISSQGWTDIPRSPDMVGLFMVVSAGYHRIYHPYADSEFGAYLYGHNDQQCGYAYPVGMCLNSINTVSRIPLSFKSNLTNSYVVMYTYRNAKQFCNMVKYTCTC